MNAFRKRTLQLDRLEPRDLPAPLVSLVRDINTNLHRGPGDEESFVAVGNIVYFTAEDGQTGIELWRTDGTTSGTFLVRDIQPGAVGSEPRYLANFNGTLYFSANETVHGRELWKSDGTSTGTVLVCDVNPGPNSSDVIDLTNAAGKLYFSGNSPGFGAELWTSDGTSAGTALLRDIATGASSSTPVGFVNAGSTVFFTVYESSSSGALYKSDGTSAGTVLVDPANSNLLYHSTSDINDFTPFGNELYFSGYSNGSFELWHSDGTSLGTDKVIDLGPGSANGLLGIIAQPFGGKLAFIGNDGGGPEVWTTANGVTTKLTDFPVEAGAIRSVTVVGGDLFCSMNSSGAGRELWRIDPLGNRTLIADINPGTADGVADIGSVNLNGTLLFSGITATTGAELWKSDGTSAGTTLLRDIMPGTKASNITFCAVAADYAVFTAQDGTGYEVWRTDGTVAGTYSLGDLWPGTFSSTPNKLFNDNGTLQMAATRDTRSQHYRSDGTSAGTFPLNRVNGGSTTVIYEPSNFVNHAGSLYFRASSSINSPTGTSNFSIYKSNGTSSGTSLVSSFSGSSIDSSYPFVSAGSYFYFVASDSTNGQELWRSYGTNTGTALVRNLTAGAGSTTFRPQGFCAIGSTLYFLADDSVSGMELWKTDGTSVGTVMVRDIGPGSFTSWAESLTLIGSTIYFAASDAQTGIELWKSNGTSTGTVLVADVEPGILGSDPTELAGVNGEVYFRARTLASGFELYRSNGTSTGTVLVADLLPGAAGSLPGNLAPFGTKLLFAANGGSGNELWISDGTSAGTGLLKEINSGSSSTPSRGVEAGSFAYFTADDGVHGRELWRTDGTSTGTILATDLYPGPIGSSPVELTALSGKVYFAANHPFYGAELFRVEDDLIAPLVSSITSPVANGVYATGQMIPVTLTFSEAVTLTGGPLLVALDSGGVVSIAPFSGTTTTGTYAISAGEASPRLNATGLSLGTDATLTDLAGNPALLTLPLGNLAVNHYLIVNPAAPTTVVNAGAIQRSRLTQIRVDFSTPVFADLTILGAITLTRTTPVVSPAIVQTGATGSNGRILVAPIAGSPNSVLLTFDNANGAAVTSGVEYGSLADGRWQLSIPSLQYTGSVGHRLFGDVDGNGTVDATDFSFFPNFGAATNSPFDFNNNGDIDSATDLAQFGNRFGLTL